MTNKQSVLVLGEDRNVRTQILRLLAGSELANADPVESPAAVILGCLASIPKRDLETARSLAGNAAGIPIVLFTAAGSECLAIEAMRAGILNYFRLPDTSAEFDEALAIAIPRTAPAARPQEIDRMIGDSKIIRSLKSYLVRAAACSSNVLITGETGCGKELAAELIHQYSDRAARPMVTVNCAAIPDSLFESELFGFERGAFTGAYAAQDGKLRLADQGTVFLDEIGDLTPYAQAKLLRAIESGEIQRLGGRKAQRVDIRVIAATNRDLELDTHFRKDLFFRLNVAQIHLPPLRERKEDILPIAEMFRREFDRKFGRRTTGFTSSARELMLTHAWPGNVRELRNVIESSFIDLARDASEVALPAQFCKAVEAARGESRGELERILLTLSETQWNKSRAAERLHWSRMTLYRKMAQYQIRRAAGNAS
jgi:DNA-binding NtrC family response regulator